MRITRLILFVSACLFGNLRGAETAPARVSPNAPDAERATDTLTNLAGCLNHARTRPDLPVFVGVEATITLVDRERNIVVLQDDSAAMAVATPLSGLALGLGQRVRVGGNSIVPCVRTFPDYPDRPSGKGFLESFETPSGQGSNYLARIRGYLHPPVSGQYTFWITADDALELCLSSDASPHRSRRIAATRIGNSTRPGEWTRYPTQRSRAVTLNAGEVYYVEALHVQTAGSDSLAVAWEGPGIERSVIAGRYLTPWSESSSGGTRVPQPSGPTYGLLREYWTNYFVRDYESLHSLSQKESFVRIGSLKLTVTGEGPLPPPQWIDAETNPDSVPNLCWVELEGDVDFAAASDGKIRLELNRQDSTLGVRVLNWNGQPVERWMQSHVRLRGLLVQSYGPTGELIGHVMWVPDPEQLSVLGPSESPGENFSRVSIPEIEPSNPEMSWGRRVSVRGHITRLSTNGLVLLESGDTFQAFGSSDGSNWVSLARPVEVGMGNALGGLALASHSSTRLTAARFDHVGGLGTNWLGTNIGKPLKDAAPAFDIEDQVLTLRGGGREIGVEADQQSFLYQHLEGGADLCARLVGLEQLDSRTQAGLMVRESLDRQSPYAAVLFTPRYGAIFQYRLLQGDTSVGVTPKAGSRSFRWMKLRIGRSTLVVEGDAGSEFVTNQEVEVTGKLTWRNRTPVLTEGRFQPATAPATASLAMVREPQRLKSIASFVAAVQRSTQLYPRGRLEGSNLVGIVTFCGNVLGKNVIFVQGGKEGGIEIGWADLEPELEVGQMVEMSGRADIDRFPVVFEPTRFQVTGWGTLPEPVEFSANLTTNGTAQARWIEAKGVIRSESTNGLMSLITREGALEVWMGHRPSPGAPVYLDALVRMRGVLSCDPAHRARLLVPGPAFVEIEAEPPADPFALPSFSIAELYGLTWEPEHLRRMRVCGVVTCVLKKGVYIQDETGGVFVEAPEGPAVQLGDRVEVVGFPNRRSSVVVSSAVLRKTGTSPMPAPARFVPEQDRRTDYGATVVQAKGVVLEQTKTWQGEELMLQAGSCMLRANLVHRDNGSGRLAVLEPGSLVAVTGVCLFQPDNAAFESENPDSQTGGARFLLRLRTAADVVLLQRPPLWTWKRVSVVLALFAGALLGALGWVRMLRRRVAQRSRELQVTMRQLEQKTHAAAVLAERDRLAGEIHDSVEQGLTAIMLQLDRADNHLENSPQARNLLRTARNMAEFSRAEVQLAVWDVQSPLLENADFSTALKHVAEQVSSSLAVVSVEIVGTPYPFRPSHEHHLLRIAQEAITNACKHAQARTIQTTADYSAAQFKLTIADDGVGFVQGEVKSDGQSGHFGLKGMRSRAKKIKAQLEISSAKDKGTIITVCVEKNHQPSENTGGRSKPL
jgi:signal transduction histidine kinase